LDPSISGERSGDLADERCGGGRGGDAAAWLLGGAASRPQGEQRGDPTAERRGCTGALLGTPL